MRTLDLASLEAASVLRQLKKHLVGNCVQSLGGKSELVGGVAHLESAQLGQWRVPGRMEAGTNHPDGFNDELPANDVRSTLIDDIRLFDTARNSVVPIHDEEAGLGVGQAQGKFYISSRC